MNVHMNEGKSAQTGGRTDIRVEVGSEPTVSTETKGRGQSLALENLPVYPVDSRLHLCLHTARKPLSQKDLQEKFRTNSCRTLSCHAVERLIEIVENLEDLEDCSVLTTLLKETSPPKIASKSI